MVSATAVFLSFASAEPIKKHPAPCQISYPSDATIEWECRTLRSGESLENVFHDGWIEVARFNRIDRRHARPAEQDQQFILIDLSEQFLGAYEYGVLRFAAPIASGNGEAETPTGEFRLTAAHRSHSPVFT